MLYGYSDASVINKSAAATTLIIDDNSFITCFTNTYENVNSTEAEFLGVLQTMAYISENCTDKKVVLLTDNKTVVLRCISALSNWKVADGSLYEDYLKQFLKMCKSFSVSVQNIRGHQQSHNPNKICDIISRIYLCGTQ